MAVPAQPSASRLSREVIVDAFLRIADSEGTDDISLRRLGGELGVDPTAVYRHFRDKNEILAVAADRVLADAAADTDSTGSWREDLRAVQMAMRRAYLSHPRAMLAHETHPSAMPNAERLTDRVIGLLRQAGLQDPEAAVAYEALEDYTVGTALFDTGFTEETLGGWRRAFAAARSDLLPHLVATSSLLYRDVDAAFEYGLDLMLDGLERRGERYRMKGKTPEEREGGPWPGIGPPQSSGS